MKYALGFAALLGSLSCEAKPPEDPDAPNRLTDAGAPPYADVVLVYQDTGSIVRCDIPAPCEEQAGDCGTHAALGAPDSQSFQIRSGEVLELGFLCNVIVDRAEGGQRRPDFKIWAQVQGQAVISGSVDGSEYTLIDNLSSADQEFDLTEQQLQFIRFLRIAPVGNSSVEIDAVEVLQ